MAGSSGLFQTSIQFNYKGWGLADALFWQQDQTEEISEYLTE